MPPVCPQCANPIEADFGVVTCPKCNSVLFIDMEGNAQLSENSESFPSAQNFESPKEVSTEQSNQDMDAPSFQESWMQDQNPAPFESPEAPMQEFESAESVAPAYEEASYQSEPEQIPPEYPATQNDDDLTDFSEAPTQVRSPRKISEVADFSNSDQAAGPLSYSVKIEEIDTKEIRQQLADALSDPKFQWDSRELMKQIEMGTLHLEKLSPVKASVLVYSLQAVPVKVSWVQNVYE